MGDDRHEGSRETSGPVPRDLPDQQARPSGDPWEAPGDRHGDTTGKDEPGTDVPDTDVPDTDEAGTGRRGAPRSGAEPTEHPVPDEPSA